nr:hypothetical protein [Tanacetum cinerariifolium]
ILGDKIICDLHKIPDLSQQSPQNCPKCGNLVDDSSKSSNDDTNVVNALREPFVVNQDPGKNSSQSPPQINHHCCYECGNSLDDIFCHQCTCELCGTDAHYGYNCSPKVLIFPNPEPFNNQTIKELPPTLPSFDPTCYSEDGNSFTYDSTSNLIHDSLNVLTHLRNFLSILVNSARTMLVMVTIVHLKFRLSIWNRVTIKTLISRKIFMIFNNKIFVVKIPGLLMKLTNEEEKQIEEELVANARYWKIPACCDDDDDDYTISITHKEPDNSLSMGDDHLDTIPATKSDESIKSSVENLSQTQVISRVTMSFAGELTLLKSIPPGINETDCDPEKETHFIKRFLYDNSSPRPTEEFVSENSDAAIESFSPSPILVEDSDSLMKEIDLSFTSDYPIPSGIEEDDYDSERDILILEEMLRNDSLSLPKNESFHFDIPSSSRPPAKPPDGNTGILNVKVMGDISEQKVSMPRLMSTQSILVPNQEKSPDLLPHQGHEAFQPSTECLMTIYRKNTPILDVLLFHFYPP